MIGSDRSEYIGQTLWSSDGKLRGKILNVTERPCFEGCGGARLSVRWSDGTLTYPCSRAIEPRGKDYKIGR